MTKEILYEIINSESEKLTSAEIENILNEELEKSPDEMDTDLVDLCLEALTSVDTVKFNKKKRHIKLTKILIAAIIFALAVCICVPVCARHFAFDVPKGVVDIYKDNFVINLPNGDDDNNVSNINEQLSREGIDDPVLPSFIYFDDTRIFDYEAENFPEINSRKIHFYFEQNDIDGSVTIESVSKEYIGSMENEKVPSKYDSFKYLNVKNVNILVYSSDNYSNIEYINNNVKYTISVECDFETALEFAKDL